MSRDDRHINDFWSRRIYDYLFGRAYTEGRNALEREEQRDPFLSDAINGLEGLNSDEYLSDIKELQGRFISGAKNRGVIKWIAVAATVIFIVGISSLLFLLIPQSTYRLAQNKKKPVSEVEKINEDYNKKAQEIVIEDREDDSVNSEVAESKQAKQKRATASTDTKSVEEANVLYIVEDDAEMSEELEISDSEFVVGVKKGKAMPKAAVRTTGFDSGEVLSEVVSPVQVKIEDRDAEPAMGMKRYKETLKSQIGELLDGKRLKVTVKLIISAEGEVSEVEILKTSNDKYSNEIKRLFKEGDVWLPAYRNGGEVKDEVTIKLIIKKGKRPLSSLQT